jgi:hypothetical protein
MPFTPAHPAIVLPFLRSRYVSATGLIVGTVSPDFEYFFKMSVDDAHGHTLRGILYFDLPVSILLAFVFHLFVKASLIDNTPFFIQRRFTDLKRFDFVNYFKKNWMLFSISAMIGAGLHIFWDGFTHGSGFFVQRITWLSDARFPFHGVRYPMWYAMQHICSYIGLAVILFFILLMKPDPACVLHRPSVYYWLIISGVMAATMFLRFYWLPETFKEGNIAVSLISALCIALVIAGRFRFANNSIQI